MSSWFVQFGGSHQKEVVRVRSSFEWDRADLKKSGTVATLKMVRTPHTGLALAPRRWRKTRVGPASAARSLYWVRMRLWLRSLERRVGAA